MSNKVLVTGATGFVGSNLVKYLVNNSFEVFIIVREESNLTNLQEVTKNLKIYRYNNVLQDLILFFNQIKPDCVFHLASSFIAEHRFNQVNQLVDSNITFGLHILEAMRESGVKNLINTGTSWQHYNNEDYNPVCLYAATKQAFESLIEYYIKAEGFKVITLKLFDTYGESDTRPKLINLLNKFANDQTELNMSAGDQVLNLVHINDVCKAYDIAYKQILKTKPKDHLIYSVKHQENYTLKEVIALFEKVTSKKININWGKRPYRKREVMTLWNKTQNLPNWSAEISLTQGFNLYD